MTQQINKQRKKRYKKVRLLNTENELIVTRGQVCQGMGKIKEIRVHLYGWALINVWNCESLYFSFLFLNVNEKQPYVVLFVLGCKWSEGIYICTRLDMAPGRRRYIIIVMIWPQRNGKEEKKSKVYFLFNINY